jgi:large subunit ribosomal protein L18
MANSTTRRTVPYRRKREGKTNYKKRLELLKGKEARLVVRRTNKHIIMQIVEYHPDGDKILLGVSSKKLESMGWKHSGKNIPAAYLTGLLLGKTAATKNITKAHLDLGLRTPMSGSRLYAALKGTIDGGLDVPASKDVFPADDRITGKHIQNEAITKDFEALKNKIN